MLSETRKQQARLNVSRYLQDNLLIKVQSNTNIIQLLRANARESLEIAQMSYTTNRSYLWTIVCAYYSMFYYANAVLLTRGYKVGDKIVHKVTADSLIVLITSQLTESMIEDYEEVANEALQLAGLKAESIIESFDREREKRNYVQYHTSNEDKKAKAETSLNRAIVFRTEIEKLL